MRGVRVTGGFGHAWLGLSGFLKVALKADLAVIIHNARIGEGALIVLERNHLAVVQWTYPRGHRMCETFVALERRMR